MSVRRSEPSITVRERVIGEMSLAGRRRWHPVEGHRPPQAFCNRLSRAVGVYAIVSDRKRRRRQSRARDDDEARADYPAVVARRATSRGAFAVRPCAPCTPTPVPSTGSRGPLFSSGSRCAPDPRRARMGMAGIASTRATSPPATPGRLYGDAGPNLCSDGETVLPQGVQQSR